MDDFEIGSRHMIWVNPFCLDILAEVVAFDRAGRPIMRTLDDGDLTLEPHEYVIPDSADRSKIEMVSRHFKEMYGEEL